MGTKQFWFKCNVRPGMFSDEAIVEFRARDGQEWSFFVPKNKVEDDRVLVHLVRRNGVPWITVPTAHPHMGIPVRDEDLQEERSSPRDPVQR